MQDIPRDAELDDTLESSPPDRDDVISAAVTEARRQVRRTELKTNSALDAISDWIEKREIQRTEEARRLAVSQERMAATVRDALGVVTGRLNHLERGTEGLIASAVRDALGTVTERLDHIESLVSNVPDMAFAPIRSALGRLDGRVGAMEEQQGDHTRNAQRISEMMENLGQRLTEVVGKIDELGDTRSHGDAEPREERIAGIEAKLGTILQQLSRPAEAAPRDAPPPPRPAWAASAEADAEPRPRVVLRTVSSSGRLEAAVADIRRRQSELGGPAMPAHMHDDTAQGFAGLRDELGVLSSQLKRLEEGRIDGDKLGDLLASNDELRRLVADPNMPKLAARLDQGIADLTMRVDSLSHKSVDRAEISGLTAAIADLRDKLVAPRPIGGTENVERRLEALSAKIDDVMREPLGMVGQHLADLSARLGSPALPGAQDATIADIRDKLDRIVARGNAPMAEHFGHEDGAFAQVRDRLDELSARFGQETPSAGMTELRERLDRLTASIEHSAVGAPDKIDRVLRQIAANMEATRQLDPNPGAIQALEKQVAGLAQRLETGHGPALTAADLERQVARLFDEIADTKAAAVNAAEVAASDAAHQATEAVRGQRRDENDGNGELRVTLANMNAMLEHMMTRLASLDEQPRPAPATAPAAMMEPVAPAAMEPFAPAAPVERELALPQRKAAAPVVTPTPRQASPEPAAEFPAAIHEPLEPGSGRPPHGVTADVAAEPLRADAARRIAATEADAAGPAMSGAMSAQALIAAARRAAADTAVRQKAVQASSSPSPLGSAKEALSNLTSSAGAHKKPILLALIGLMVVFSAVGAGRLILGGGISPANRPAPGAAAPAPVHPAAAPEAVKPVPMVPPGPPSNAVPPAPGDSSSLGTPAPDVVGSIPKVAPEAPAVKLNAKPDAGPKQAAADPQASPDFLPRLKLAADAGDAAAQYLLATRMYDGNGVPRDATGAAKLFERAANQGSAPAGYRLANIYETGVGATKDLAAAKRWFMKAASLGNAKAMHNVGVYLAQGVDGKPDYTGAVGWFTKAAERDVRDSQFNLGILLARGLGTQRDFKASYMWFSLAARSGDSDSAKKRDEVGQRLSATELDAAKAMTAKWTAIEVDRAANEVAASDVKWAVIGSAAKTESPKADSPKTGSPKAAKI